MVKKDLIKMPWTRYGTVKQGDREIKTGKFDESGVEIVHHVARNARVIDPMSPRGVYLRMKKAGPQAVLAGKA